MGDYRTEPFDPSPRDDEDYEYASWSGDRGPAGPTVLWGRVAVFGAALLLAFMFGRACAPAGGVSEERFQTVRGDLKDAQDEVVELRASLEAAAQPKKTPKATPTATEEGGFAGDEYEVQSGDTLSSIAAEFYGDAKYDDFLAEVNDIDDPSTLAPGTIITIPDEPEE